MHLTRRFFLRSTGAAAAYLGVAPSLLSPRALALHATHPAPRAVNAGKTLVVIFLRGGADGLNLVVPFADPGYAPARRTIAVPNPGQGENASLDLDGFFGLHPGLAPLMPHFKSGLAAAAHAVGYDKNTRSHFEEQDVWETGVVGNTLASDGWLNRHLATSTGRGPLRAVAVGDSLPRILRGPQSAFALRGLSDLSLGSSRTDPAALRAAMEHAYCTPEPSEHARRRDDSRAVLEQAAAETLQAMKQLESLAAQKYTPAAEYPDTEPARRLREVARMIKADIGLEVAEVDFGGWDTHNQQGPRGGGQFNNLVTQLGAAVAAFLEDLKERLDDVLVVTLTDFGRTAAENGTQGTDHGWANAMLAAGGAVARATKAASEAGKPRSVVTNWPGLLPDQLHEGRDLLHTTDFRDVLAELVRVHLGNPNLEAVLPGRTFAPVGLVS